MIQSNAEPKMTFCYTLTHLNQIQKSQESLPSPLPLLVLVFLKKYQKVRVFIGANLIFLLCRCWLLVCHLLITWRHLSNWRAHYSKRLNWSLMTWPGGSCVLWLTGQQSWQDDLIRAVLVARKLLNKNKYFEAWYVRWLKASENAQDLTVWNEILHVATLITQCIVKL